MTKFCDLCKKEFDDSVRLCPVHLHLVGLVIAKDPAPPKPELTSPRPVEEPHWATSRVLTIRFAGITQNLLPGPGILIGRSPQSPFGAHLEGIGWTNISGLHCVLRISDADQVEVLDLDSSNGTFVNGIRLSPNVPRILVSGESLRLAANREVDLTWG